MREQFQQVAAAVWPRQMSPMRWAMAATLLAAMAMAACGIVFDGRDRGARGGAYEQNALLAARRHDPLHAVSLDKVRSTGLVPPAFAASIVTDLDALEPDAKKQAFLGYQLRSPPIRYRPPEQRFRTIV